MPYISCMVRVVLCCVVLSRMMSAVFDAALWSICSTAYEPPRHRKSSEALLIESTLSQLYGGSSEAIDLAQLCIEAVRYVQTEYAIDNTAHHSVTQQDGVLILQCSWY